MISNIENMTFSFYPLLKDKELEQALSGEKIIWLSYSALNATGSGIE